jgi:hypothetical protein
VMIKGIPRRRKICLRLTPSLPLKSATLYCIGYISVVHCCCLAAIPIFTSKISWG